MGLAYYFVWFSIIFSFKYIEAVGGKGVEDEHLILSHARTPKASNLSWPIK